jgi:hypothetical protein
MTRDPHRRSATGAVQPRDHVRQIFVEATLRHLPAAITPLVSIGLRAQRRAGKQASRQAGKQASRQAGNAYFKRLPDRRLTGHASDAGALELGYAEEEARLPAASACLEWAARLFQKRTVRGWHLDLECSPGPVVAG